MLDLGLLDVLDVLDLDLLDVLDVLDSMPDGTARRSAAHLRAAFGGSRSRGPWVSAVPVTGGRQVRPSGR